MKMMSKITIEAALNAELDDHLGYDKHEVSDSSNSRNGYTSKTILTEDGSFEIDTPRDRNGDFEPKLIKKNQRRMPSVQDKVMHFYTRGLSTREIADTLKELYDADVSPTLISNITNAVIDKVIEWQSRPLDAIYPIVYLDCIVLKVRQDKRVINKSVYLALGVNL